MAKQLSNGNTDVVEGTSTFEDNIMKEACYKAVQDCRRRNYSNNK